MDNKFNNLNEITKSQKNKINNTNKNSTEDNKFKSEDRSKDSSIISDNKNKSKINLLNLGINFNSININNNNHIKNRNSYKNIHNINNIFDENCNVNATNIKMNIFYYYCFSRCKNYKDDIHLLNLAISFYKKKMDIIHLFYIILLIEKISKINEGKI